jgi:hypothetical protein
MIQVIIELLKRFITCGCGCNIYSLCCAIFESISFLSSSLSCSPSTSLAFYPFSWICRLFFFNILSLAMASFAACSSNNWTLLSSWIFFGGLQLNDGCVFFALPSVVFVLNILPYQWSWSLDDLEPMMLLYVDWKIMLSSYINNNLSTCNSP